MTGRKGHLVDLADIPCRDDVAAGVGLVTQIVNEACDLVDAFPLTGFPSPPLLSVDRPKITVFVSPFVPYPYLVLLQVSNIGIPHQKPEQFMDDGSEMKFLGGKAGKSLAQVIADLSPENRAGSGASAVSALFAVFENIAEQIQVLPHAVL